MASTGTAPGRNSAGCGSSATIVDSSPYSLGPAVENQVDALPERLGDVLGASRAQAPNGFALGAASGSPTASSSARATGCDGMRTATV